MYAIRTNPVLQNPTMKLLLVNPNTSSAMTAGIAQAARDVAAAGTQIVAVNPSFGPLSIEGQYDDARGGADKHVRRAPQRKGPHHRVPGDVKHSMRSPGCKRCRVRRR